MKRRKDVTKKRTLQHSRRTARLPRSAQELASKPNRFQDAYSQTIEVLKKMRSDRALSVRKAAVGFKIDPRKVIRIGSSGLRRRKNGRFSVRPDDKLLRTLVIETSEGRRDITVRRVFKQASLAGEHANAIRIRAFTGEATAIQEFHGKHIIDANGNKVEFLTDLSQIDQLANAGVLSFESLYSRSA